MGPCVHASSIMVISCARCEPYAVLPRAPPAPAGDDVSPAEPADRLSDGVPLVPPDLREPASSDSLLHDVTLQAEGIARASDCSAPHQGKFEQLIAEALGRPSSSLRKELTQPALRKIVRF